MLCYVCCLASSTFSGQVYLFYFRVSGYMMTNKLEVPRRRVRKDWHVGLHPDPMDRSHPDVNDDQLVQEAAEMKLFSSKLIKKKHTRKYKNFYVAEQFIRTFQHIL